MPDRSSYAVERRLDYIDYVMLVRGSIRRADIMRQFGVSEVKASQDIARFLAAHPDALEYDKRAKQYVPTQAPYRTRRELTPAVLDAMERLAATGHPAGWR